MSKEPTESTKQDAAALQRHLDGEIPLVKAPLPSIKDRVAALETFIEEEI